MISSKDIKMEMLIPLIAVIAGLLAGYFFAQKQFSPRITAGELQLREKESQLLAHSSSLARAEEKLAAVNQRLLDQQQQVSTLSAQFRTEFSVLAQSILEEKSKSFSELSESKLNTLINPLKEQMTSFRQKVEETYDRESKERFSLEKELRVLIGLNKQLGEEANNLTHALKYNNKVQGNWGEMILESLLQHSGLVEGREYFVQQFLRDESGELIRDEEGKALQPDLTLVYPDQRKVIIDSKVSLIAFEEYVSAADPDSQAQKIKEHLRSLRNHIDGLSRKNYPRYAGQALDYVILFVPVEPAFLLAVKEDTQLWKYAYDRRILVVSPTNLLAVLKIIADLWKVEQQSRHAIEIAEKAGALYDRFVLFTESLDDVSRHLNKATEAHEQAMKRLSTGNGNLVKRAEQLRIMGAKATKRLGTDLLQDAAPEE